MNRDWDKAVPSVDIWKECLRVMKDGAFAFVMSAPRSDVQAEMIKRLELAGFNVAFTPIYWTYATGFPKASNIGKMVDKRLGVEREVIGTKITGGIKRPPNALKSNSEYNENRTHNYTSGQKEINVTIPTSPQAKALEGSYAGFQPKPAVEIVLVVMKPIKEKSYVEQALKNGKGITFLDDCRIPFRNKNDKWDGHIATGLADIKFFSDGNAKPIEKSPNNNGRFPANLLVSDDVLNDGKVTNSIRSKRGGKISSQSECYVWNKDKKETFDKNNAYECGYIDSGSFSRYFNLDAWWNKRVKKLPENVQKTFPFIITPKASKSEKNKGCKDLEEKKGGSMEANVADVMQLGGASLKGEHKPIQSTKNNHPTVKPLKLMSYLVTLGSRPNDVVLDPFMGSGSVAVVSRMLGRKVIGFDIDKEFCRIANARLRLVNNKWW